MCGKTRGGAFKVKRQTTSKRMRAKLREIKQQLRRRMHDPAPQTGEWLRLVVQGYFNYQAVPGNLLRLGGFPEEGHLTLAPDSALSRAATPAELGSHVPPGRAMATPAASAPPLSRAALCRYSSKIRAPCGNVARGDPRGGQRATAVPTATHQAFTSASHFESFSRKSRSLEYALDPNC
jgi:hypothetical protein